MLKRIDRSIVDDIKSILFSVMKRTHTYRTNLDEPLQIIKHSVDICSTGANLINVELQFRNFPLINLLADDSANQVQNE